MRFDVVIVIAIAIAIAIAILSTMRFYLLAFVHVFLAIV